MVNLEQLKEDWDNTMNALNIAAKTGAYNLDEAAEIRAGQKRIFEVIQKYVVDPQLKESAKNQATKIPEVIKERMVKNSNIAMIPKKGIKKI